MTSIAARAQASGLFVVHSCPKAVISHVEWALASRIGTVVKLDWSPQPLLADSFRAEAAWSGPIGTAAAVASALFGWHQLRFEMTEDPTAMSDGGRWMCVPDLGVFHMQTDSAGNGVLTENAVRAAIDAAGSDPTQLAKHLRLALGEAWDQELEPFRQAEPGDATIFALPRLNAG